MSSKSFPSLSGVLARTLERLEPRRLLSTSSVGDASIVSIALPSQRTGEAIGVVGSTVVFAGGSAGNAYANYLNNVIGYYTSTNEVDLYDTATGRLSAGAPMPERRDGARAISVGGHLLVYGGGSGDTSFLVYDLAGNAWSTMNNPPTQSLGGAVTVGGNRLVVPDGTRLHVYDATTDQWTSVALLSSPLATQVVGHRVYLFEAGGTVESYDADTAARAVTHTDSAANFSGAHAAVDGAVVFAGGSTADTPYDGGAYDLASGTWTPATTGAAPGPAVTTVGHKAIFAGGEGGPLGFGFGNGGSNKVAIFDAATGQWTQAHVGDGRSGIDAFTIGHEAFFAGGFGGGDAIGTVFDLDVYDDSTGQWTLNGSIGYSAGPDIADTGSALDVPATGVHVIVGNPGSGSFSVFSAGPLATQPTAASPAAGAGLASGAVTTASWSAVAGATHYDVFLDDQPSGSTTGTSALLGSLADGAHTWQVVARDDAADVSPGPRVRFTVGAPGAVSSPSIPSGATLTAAPQILSWSPASGATKYAVYLDGRRLANTDATALSLNFTIPGGPHAWSVVAYNALTSTAGPTWTFSLPPTPLARTVTRLPRRRGRGAEMVTAGNQVLVFGGTTDPQSPITDMVDVYDIPSGTWSTTDLPSKVLPYGQLSLAQWASCGDDAVFVGNFHIAVYNSRIGEWAWHALSVPRGAMTIAQVGDEIVLAGGVDANNAPSDAVDLFNTRSGQWSTARLSAPRLGIAAAVLGDRLYLAGGGTAGQGSSGDVASAAVDIFDASTGAWSTAALSVARQSPASAVAGARYVIFAGGYTRDSASYDAAAQRLDVYDAVSGTWSTDQLPDAAQTFGLQAIGIGGRAYFASSGSGAEGTLAVYDPAARAWAVDTLPPNGSNYSIAPLGRNLLVYNNDASIEVFDTKTGRATFAAAPAGVVGPPAVTTAGRAAFLAWPSDSNAQAKLEMDVYTDPAFTPSITASFARTPAANTIAHGGSDTVSVNVQAAANTSLSGPITVTVYASPHPVVEGYALPLGTVTVQPTHTRRGASQVIDVPVQIPVWKRGGPYYLVASVTMTGARAVIASDRPILHLPTSPVTTKTKTKHAARAHPVTAWETQ